MSIYKSAVIVYFFKMYVVTGLGDKVVQWKPAFRRMCLPTSGQESVYFFLIWWIKSNSRSNNFEECYPVGACANTTVLRHILVTMQTISIARKTITLLRYWNSLWIPWIHHSSYIKFLVLPNRTLMYYVCLSFYCTVYFSSVGFVFSVTASSVLTKNFYSVFLVSKFLAFSASIIFSKVSAQWCTKNKSFK